MTFNLLLLKCLQKIILFREPWLSEDPMPFDVKEFIMIASSPQVLFECLFIDDIIPIVICYC